MRGIEGRSKVNAQNDRQEENQRVWLRREGGTRHCGLRRTRHRSDRSPMDSYSGNVRRSEGWWSLQEPLSRWVCKCEEPNKLEVRPRYTSPSTARNSSILLSCEDSGSTGSLGSSSRSKRRCGWTRSRRSNKGTRPRIRDCSSARLRGSRGPRERGFVRNVGQSCGLGNCRIGRRLGCCCTSLPWRNREDIRRSVGLRGGPTRSSPSPRRRATYAEKLMLDRRWRDWIEPLLSLGFQVKM